VLFIKESAMKHNPDDRTDNVEKIQRTIDRTIGNMERAEERIEKTSDRNVRENLQGKNRRREEALRGLRREIKEEAEFRKECREP